MEKTIAIVVTADTKKAELEFVRDFITGHGFEVLTIDVSSRGLAEDVTDISAAEVARAGGYTIEMVHQAGSRARAIEMMQTGIKAMIVELYQAGRIHAVLGLGGLQNSILSSSAMQLLPIGVPKVLLSTVACGSRTFESLMGAKDIMLLPSIGDLVGINPLTRVGLKNAAAAIMGMVQYAGEELQPDGFLVGATIMGATSEGILEAIQKVAEAGFEVITFHSTGMGGAALEEQINAGIINAVLDLSLHEIVSQDVIGGGFSTGAKARLRAAAQNQLPMVLAPGGLDFVDFSVRDFKDGVVGDPAQRKFTLHNQDIAHIKLFPDEAAQAARIVVARLADVRGNAVMILPLKGLRAETRAGERLYDPEVDEAIFDVFRKELNKNITLIELDAHLSDPIFSQTAADALIGLLK